jgi:hypothetical protein
LEIPLTWCSSKKLSIVIVLLFVLPILPPVNKRTQLVQRLSSVYVTSAELGEILLLLGVLIRTALNLGKSRNTFQNTSITLNV